MNILEKITERTKERIEEEKNFGQTDYPLSARQRKLLLPKD